MSAVEASIGRAGDSQQQDIQSNVEQFGLARKVALRREAARQKVSSLAFDRHRNAINGQRALGRINPQAHFHNDEDDPLSQLTGSRKREDAWKRKGDANVEERQPGWEDEEGRWKDQDMRAKSSSKEQMKDAKKRRLFNANSLNWAAPARPHEDWGERKGNVIPGLGLPASSQRLTKDPRRGVGTAPGKAKALLTLVQDQPLQLDVEKALDHSLELLGSFDVESYLSAQRMLEGQGDPMTHFRFNQVASDATPPNRELPDVRHVRYVSALCLSVCPSVHL